MKPLICIFCLLAPFHQASSHEFLTEILVYPEDTIAVDPYSTMNVIKTIYLSPEELYKAVGKDLVKQEIKRIVAKRADDVPQEAITCDDWDVVFKTCGAFDHWSAARSVAIDQCIGLGVSYAGLYPDGLIPQFIGPATFIEGSSATTDHHDIYFLDHGLSFNCVEVISFLPVD